jgi:hypothetical protein
MRKLLVFSSALLLLALAGCSTQQPTNSLPDSQNIVVRDIPADLRQVLDYYSFPEDQFPALPNRASADDTPPNNALTDYHVYAVTIIWGDFFTGAPPSLTTDWTGTLSVNADAIVNVTNEIDFEPGEDSVFEHNAVHFAAWQSFTSGDFDGLSFLVYVNFNVEYFAPPLLTFETSPFTESWNFDQLGDFSAFYVVNNLHAVAIHSERVWPHRCPSGFIRGEWVKSEIFADSGHFHGTWLRHDGNPIGYLSGNFWTNNDGTREFAGAISGYYTDEVLGSVYGTWMYDDYRLCPLCGAGHGLFRGVYHMQQNDISGYLAGEFGDYSLPYDQLNLPMHGFWKQRCPSIQINDQEPVVQ